MPIYEYQCAKCKKVHEIWHKMSDPPETKCPSCGGKVERLISQSGFALKGSGWYKTDYERKGKGPKKDKEKKDGGGESKSDSASSDSASKSDSGSSGGSEKKDSGDSKARAA